MAAAEVTARSCGEASGDFDAGDGQEQLKERVRSAEDSDWTPGAAVDAAYCERAASPSAHEQVPCGGSSEGLVRVASTLLDGHDASHDGVGTTLDGHDASHDGVGTPLDGHEASHDGVGTPLDGHDASHDGVGTPLDGGTMLRRAVGVVGPRQAQESTPELHWAPRADRCAELPTKPSLQENVMKQKSLEQQRKMQAEAREAQARACQMAEALVDEFLSTLETHPEDWCSSLDLLDDVAASVASHIASASALASQEECAAVAGVVLRQLAKEVSRYS